MLRDRTEYLGWGKQDKGEDFPQAKAHTQPHDIVSFSFPRDHFRPLKKAGLLVLVSGATKYWTNLLWGRQMRCGLIYQNCVGSQNNQIPKEGPCNSRILVLGHLTSTLLVPEKLFLNAFRWESYIQLLTCIPTTILILS